MRLDPICTPAGNIRMVPMDHGVSDGPIQGLLAPQAAVNGVAGHATCIAAHKGFLRSIQTELPTLLHVSAGTSWAQDPHEKTVIATVEDALRLGCTGISAHLNMGSLSEAKQLAEIGQLTSTADAYDIPVIIMAYPRGPKMSQPPTTKEVAHAARLAWELGADAVKVPYCPDFGTVTDGCPAPVLVAGGPVQEPTEIMKQLGAAAANGAKGISMGRNVFQGNVSWGLIEDLWP